MNKHEREHERQLYRSLEALGLNLDDIEGLRRAAKTLHRWAERECNGEVERDEDTGKTYGTNAAWARQTECWSSGAVTVRRWRIPDREAGALRRVKAIIAAHPGLWVYHQGDPRGAALYVGSAADLSDPSPARLESYYNHGVAVW